jgi:hypothetical protein
MVLYLHGEDSDSHLLNLDNVYEREYNHCDMLQAFKSEMPHYRLVTKIIIDSEAMDASTWDAAAELLYTMKPVPILLVTHDSSTAEYYQKKQYYDVLNQVDQNTSEDIIKWMQGKLAYEPRNIIPEVKEKRIVTRVRSICADTKKYWIIAGVILLIILLSVTGLLRHDKGRLQQNQEYKEIEKKINLSTLTSEIKVFETKKSTKKIELSHSQ